MKVKYCKYQQNEKLFFEEDKQIINIFFYLRLTKRRKIQIHKIRHEKGHITADTTAIQRIIRNYPKKPLRGGYIT